MCPACIQLFSIIQYNLQPIDFLDPGNIYDNTFIYVHKTIIIQLRHDTAQTVSDRARTVARNEHGVFLFFINIQNIAVE